MLLASCLMFHFDTSIVITGLHDIREDPGFSPAGLSPVQNICTVNFGGLPLAGARVGDVFGCRRACFPGVAILTLA